jgi:hypothetical protein
MRRGFPRLLGGRRGKPRLYGRVFGSADGKTPKGLRPGVCSNKQDLLLRRYQGMRDGMDGEGDAVLHSNFAHQFCDVSFYGALLDAEG